MRRSAIWVVCFGIATCGGSIHGVAQVDCSRFDIEPSASLPLHTVLIPPTRACATRMSNGFPTPDPDCTPGAINPSLTVEVLLNPAFRTSCVRDSTTTGHEKAATYNWYGISHPENNTGSTQTCELDHLISLELGGADTLDNIWPQCGPPGVTLPERYFKEKDAVENYLARQVKTGAMDLEAAQQGIATDWSQFLDAARAACPGGRCR